MDQGIDDGRKGYLVHHRNALISVAKNARTAAEVNMDISVQPALFGLWPAPFAGRIESEARFVFESDPLWGLLVTHLEPLRVRDSRNAVHMAAEKYRNVCLELAAYGEFHDFEELLESLFAAQVQAGVDLAIKPTTEVLEFETVADGKSFVVRGGAFRLNLENRPEADRYATILNSIPVSIQRSGMGHRFVAAVSELSDCIDRFTEILTDSDLVRLNMTSTSCPRCRFIPVLSQSTQIRSDANGLLARRTIRTA